MSAPNQGRQSPDPENQTGAQQQDAPGSGKVDHDTESSDTKGKSNNALEGLESNPKGPLEDAAKEKISKTVS